MFHPYGNETKHGVYTVAGFPRVIGAVDYARWRSPPVWTRQWPECPTPPVQWMIGRDPGLPPFHLFNCFISNLLPFSFVLHLASSPKAPSFYSLHSSLGFPDGVYFGTGVVPYQTSFCDVSISLLVVLWVFLCLLYKFFQPNYMEFDFVFSLLLDTSCSLQTPSFNTALCACSHILVQLSKFYQEQAI